MRIDRWPRSRQEAKRRESSPKPMSLHDVVGISPRFKLCMYNAHSKAEADDVALVTDSAICRRH